MSLVVAAGYIATRLPSTFFPDLDEGMERTYVRLGAGNVAARCRREAEGDGKAPLPNSSEGDGSARPDEHWLPEKREARWGA